MPYAYDSVNMIVQAFEHRQNPAVYVRALRTYVGTAGCMCTRHKDRLARHALCSFRRRPFLDGGAG
jgi:hypothetical protein